MECQTEFILVNWKIFVMGPHYLHDNINVNTFQWHDRIWIFLEFHFYLSIIVVPWLSWWSIYLYTLSSKYTLSNVPILQINLNWFNVVFGIAKLISSNNFYKINKKNSKLEGHYNRWLLCLQYYNWKNFLSFIVTQTQSNTTISINLISLTKKESGAVLLFSWTKLVFNFPALVISLLILWGRRRRRKR